MIQRYGMFLPLLPFFKMENCSSSKVLKFFEKKWFEINVFARTTFLTTAQWFHVAGQSAQNVTTLSLLYIERIQQIFATASSSKLKRSLQDVQKNLIRHQKLSVHAAVKSGIEPWSNFLEILRNFNHLELLCLVLHHNRLFSSWGHFNSCKVT